MKSLGPPLVFGFAAALLLFGVISAIEPEVPPKPDRWLNAWKGAGLNAQFVSNAPAGDSWTQLRELRSVLREREHDDSIVRRYQVNMLRVEVLELAAADLLAEIPEGRHLGFRMKKKGRSVHLARSGRNIVLVAPSVRSMMMRFPSNANLVERILDAFEASAEPEP